MEASLVAQWWRMRANAGDTGSILCLGGSRTLWATLDRALEPGSHNCGAHMLQLWKPVLPRACAVQQEKLLQWEALAPQLESGPCPQQPEKALTAAKTQHSQK